MNLPNYFIADLPPEASLTAIMLKEACQALKRNREQYLLNRSTKSLVNVLSHVAKEWLNPEFPFRKLALSDGPGATGFSRGTLENGLNAFFRSLTAEAFEALLEQELGHPERLDQIVASPSEQKFSRASTATSPELLVHITAGNVPNPT
ncbi:MAG TPA: acyl-CoA reductase, partial [Patescibacteria group bacterium]|nr:acyl-CoA reductase [Patescibacteria group bacterium]